MNDCLFDDWRLIFNYIRNYKLLAIEFLKNCAPTKYRFNLKNVQSFQDSYFLIGIRCHKHFSDYFSHSKQK